MHRSGTSFCVRSLQIRGINLPGNLLPAANDNPDGFQEPAELVALNERLLSYADGLWDASWPLQSTKSPELIKRIGCELQSLLNQWCLKSESDIRKTSSKQLLALKDPRLCRTLPLLYPCLEPGHCKWGIAIIREPNAVVASLLERNGDDMSPLKGFALWMRYNLDMVKCRSINPQISDWPIISFETLLKDAPGTLQPILKQWDNKGLFVEHQPEQELISKTAKSVPDRLSGLPKHWLELGQKFHSCLRESQTLNDVPKSVIQAVEQWLETTPELSHELLALEARRRAHLGEALAAERAKHVLSWRNL